MENKKRKITYSSLLAVFILLILLNIGSMLLHLNGLEIHMYGYSVEGTIVSYEIRKTSTESKSYQCGFECKYIDSKTCKFYSTITYYPVANKVDSKEWCESKIGKPIELVIDKYGNCIARRDMTFDLIQWILLPRGILIIVGIIGIIVIVVKKCYFDKHKQIIKQQDSETSEPVYNFVIDDIYCECIESFIASLNVKNKTKQKEVCGMTAMEAKEYTSQYGNLGSKYIYWQGKTIRRNSKQYNELLDRANVEQQKNKLL